MEMPTESATSYEQMPSTTISIPRPRLVVGALVIGLAGCVALAVAYSSVAMAEHKSQNDVSSHLLSASKMECGQGVKLCGVLAVSAGLGQGVYKHDDCNLHGLWPQVGHYGDSECIGPVSSTPRAEKIPFCYNTPDSVHDPEEQASFADHEYNKHGKCAGAYDEDDFFKQACTIAQPPIDVMTEAKNSGKDLDGIADAITAAGYDIVTKDSANGQLFLAACGKFNGRSYDWIVTPEDTFVDACGSGDGPTPTSAPTGTPTPTPPPSTQKCETGVQGPACSSDSDCAYDGCVRCAHSGYCTSQPLY